MTGIVCALAGASGGRVLTIGSFVTGPTTSYGYQNGTAGTLTPTEFLSTVIFQLTHGTNNELVLTVSDGSLPNTGWYSLNINGTVFLRTSASYSLGSWIWTGVSTNPIGTSGTVIVNIA